MSTSVSTSRRAIVVIGGGASGTLVAANLLRQARRPLTVTLVERGARVGRGVAYGTDCGEHVLNVPAAGMSAFPEQPEHFLRWAAARAGQPGFPGTVGPADFLPRRLFGDYLAGVLADAAAAAAPGVGYDAVRGEAVDIEETAGGVRLLLRDGRLLEANQVVLALGNLPGEYPIRQPLPFYRSARYAHGPWAADAFDGIGAKDEVLIVGAGLTATDVILQLARRNHQGMIHALSRRGLRPQAHRAGPACAPFLDAAKLPATVHAAVKEIRARVREAEAEGVDWRAVIDAVRPHTPALWQGWSWEERARFLRHVRPHWETHRHRLAPAVAEKLETLRARGRVKFYAGRLQSLEERAGGAEAVFRPRGTAENRALRVAKVINCTGPRSDYCQYQHPLLLNLFARGWIDHDPLVLGLAARPTGEVLRYDGRPSGWLFTLGPPLKGVRWESTAVPEIRGQAQALAVRLLAD